MEASIWSFRPPPSILARSRAGAPYTRCSRTSRAGTSCHAGAWVLFRCTGGTLLRQAGGWVARLVSACVRGWGGWVRCSLIPYWNSVYFHHSHTKIPYSACMNSFRIQRLDSFHAISHGIPIRPGSGPPRLPNRSATARVGDTSLD